MTDLAGQKGSHSPEWFKRVAACPNESKHVYGPAGYLAWHEWAEKRMKTHTQHKCPGCGLYLIEKPNPKRKPTERTEDGD